MATPSDLTQPGKTLLYSLINVANPGLVNGSLSDANVTVSAPAILSGDPSGKNTKVTLTSIADAGYTGTADVTYNRLDIQVDVSDHVAPNGLSIEDDPDTAYATVADLLPAINTALTMNLQSADITNGTDPITGTYPKAASVTVVTTSLAFIGSLAVTITQPPPPMGDMVTDQSLNGFELTQLQ